MRDRRIRRERAGAEILLAGLEQLEYRGYDSAGISILADGAQVRARGRQPQPPARRRRATPARAAAWPSRAPPATTGIGHTRWATHGRVTEENAHPHFDTEDRVHVVVNGIVENYLELKQELVADGAVFTSETDAEVIAHLISRDLDGRRPRRGRPRRLQPPARPLRLRGRRRRRPDVLVAARKECPLVVGRGDGEQFLGSAIPAFLAHTREVQLIENGEIVVVRAEGVEFMRADGEPVDRAVEDVDWDAAEAEKGGYETFMLKEIHEQADAVAETIADRTVRADGVDLGDLGAIDDELLAAVRRIVIVACGTSYHAGLIGRYAIEQWARVPVEMDVASEYRYRDPVVGPGDLVIGVSQSGETADTLAAMRLARERGATVLAITNVMGSQATRDADGVLFTRAGLEIGVAARKTFVCQVAAMYLLALRLAELRGTLEDAARRARGGIKRLPHHIDALLSDGRRTRRAHRPKPIKARVLPLSRAPRRPCVCLEGALKLKEISYIATDAYAAGEMKHGPIALLDERTPVVVRRDGLARAREGRLEHAGGPRPRRPRDRRRDRGPRGHLRARRGGPARPADRLDAAADPRRDPAAAAGLPDRAAARPERRSAAQPREDRHRRVAPSVGPLAAIAGSSQRFRLRREGPVATGSSSPCTCA